MEKGAAKRFAGKPCETSASLALKPFFDGAVKYHFRRQDFHPAPSVDTVLLHLSHKVQPDLPTAHCGRFCDFVQQGQKYGLTSLLTKRQISTALRLAGLPGIAETGDILYVQWLCLFRWYEKHG